MIKLPFIKLKSLFLPAHLGTSETIYTIFHLKRKKTK